MSEHARLSFSASERWLRCPASVYMSQGRTGGDSDAAKEGTFAHSIMERTLKDFIAGVGEGTVVMVPSDVPDELKYLNMDLDEMRDCLQRCVNYVLERYNELGGEKGTVRMEIERRVDLHYISNRDDLWGTGDVILSNASTIDVIDLKYGSGIFVESDTTQNRLYVLGKMCQYMKATKGEVPWTWVRGTIMQPRFPDKNGEIFRYEEYDPEKLMDWFDKDVLPIARATDVTDLKPVAGQKQCRFCLAKPDCPAASEVMRNAISIPFAPATDGVVPEVFDDVAMMDVDRLVDIFDKTPLINGYLKSVADRIKTLLKERDKRLEGKLKLVRCGGANAWNTDEETILAEITKGSDRILKKHLVKERMLTAPAALKISKLKPAQKERLQKYISKGEGSLSVVPDSDPRDNALPDIPFETTEKVASEQHFDFL